MVDVANLFEDYQKPEGAIEVRTHVLSEGNEAILEDFLVENLPWCYFRRERLPSQIERSGQTASAIIGSKFPNPGAVMSGDFGEILSLFYLSSERQEQLIEVMKWQLKQDRNKAAPHSDIILLFRENEGAPSENDFVICAEAKAMATPSNSTLPIEKSIEGYVSDSTGRLSRTLTWLKERAVAEDTAEAIALYTRFSDEAVSTTFQKYYRSFAIIDRNLLDGELQRELDLPEQSEAFEVVVLGVPGLKDVYQRCFQRAIDEVPNE